MNCFQLIFSPTGGTERVAKAITQTWPEVQTIDLSAQNFTAPAIPFSAADLVLIAMPAFEAMAPQPALDRLALLQGNGARCALAAVYGNRAVDNTLAQMEDYARNAGFQPIATVSAVAAHSLLPEFAAGRPDDADCQQLAVFGKQILEKFTSGSDTCLDWAISTTCASTPTPAGLRQSWFRDPAGFWGCSAETPTTSFPGAASAESGRILSSSKDPFRAGACCARNEGCSEAFRARKKPENRKKFKKSPC